MGVQNPIDDNDIDENVSTPPSRMNANTSMLSVNASRVSIVVQESDDYDDDSIVSNTQTPVKAVDESNVSSNSSATPNWKNTPLKALQILEDIKQSISAEPSSTNSPSEKKIVQKEQKESPKACFVENLFFKTPAKKKEHIIPTTEIEEMNNSKNISITFSDGKKFAFKS